MLTNLVFLCLVSFTFSIPFFSDDDPDDNISTCELAGNKGYPCISYTVTTSDGYILIVHRIPYGAKSPGNNQISGKPVVYLQHGLLDSSATWVINFPNESLGFLLADAGYDVWMGNVRGNKYGQGHLNLTTDDHEFWTFTFDDMAKFDLPAITEFILAKSGQPNLYYVGHSQGTLMGFIRFSENPLWAQSKIKQFHALAPIAWLGHTTSPVRLISPLANSLLYMSELLGVDEFLPSSGFMQWLGGGLCDQPTAFLCENALWLMAGYDSKNMNSTRDSVYMTHSPAGTSTYNILHFGQLIYSKKFQAMDWGYYWNWYTYGSFYPPEYHPNAMTVPTALYSGNIDIFANPTDVSYLQTQIKNLLGSYRYSDMDHLDFTWGLNAPTEPYPQLMQLIAADVGKTK